MTNHAAAPRPWDSSPLPHPATFGGTPPPTRGLDALSSLAGGTGPLRRRDLRFGPHRHPLPPPPPRPVHAVIGRARPATAGGAPAGTSPGATVRGERSLPPARSPKPALLAFPTGTAETDVHAAVFSCDGSPEAVSGRRSPEARWAAQQGKGAGGDRDPLRSPTLSPDDAAGGWRPRGAEDRSPVQTRCAELEPLALPDSPARVGGARGDGSTGPAGAGLLSTMGTAAPGGRRLGPVFEGEAASSLPGVGGGGDATGPPADAFYGKGGRVLVGPRTGRAARGPAEVARLGAGAAACLGGCVVENGDGAMFSATVDPFSAPDRAPHTAIAGETSPRRAHALRLVAADARARAEAAEAAALASDRAVVAEARRRADAAEAETAARAAAAAAARAATRDEQRRQVASRPLRKGAAASDLGSWGDPGATWGASAAVPRDQRGADERRRLAAAELRAELEAEVARRAGLRAARASVGAA